MNVKKILTYFFYLISIYFFYRVISNIDFSSLDAYNNVRTYGISIALSLVHGGLLLIVAYVFANNLLSYARVPRSIHNLKVVSNKYVLANVGKYIPGNVVHYVGRNGMLKAVGFGHKLIAFCSFQEVAMFGITSMVLALAYSSPLVINQLRNYFDITQVIIIILVVLIFCLISAFILTSKYKDKLQEIYRNYQEFITKEVFKSLTISFVLYAIYMLAVGFMLLLVYKIIFDLSFSPQESMEIIGGFIIGYFVGMVAPGVPGGIGVRELVIIGVLTPLGNQEILFAGLIIHRLITIAGDVISIGYIKLIELQTREKLEIKREEPALK